MMHLESEIALTMRKRPDTDALQKTEALQSILGNYNAFELLFDPVDLLGIVLLFDNSAERNIKLYAQNVLKNLYFDRRLHDDVVICRLQEIVYISLSKGDTVLRHIPLHALHTLCIDSSPILCVRINGLF